MKRALVTVQGPYLRASQGRAMPYGSPQAREVAVVPSVFQMRCHKVG